MLVPLLCATPLLAQTLNVEEGAMHEPVIASTAGLQGWLQDFRLRAGALGVPQATLDAVLPGLTYLPDVVERDRNQAEFTRAIWDYLDRAVSDLRIEMGRKALEDHAALLAQIEATYGVE